MNRIALAIGGVMLLAGCTQSVMDAPDPNIAPPAPVPRCDAARVRGWAGRIAKPALVEQGRRMSGAAVVRIITPGSMVTMDYRTDRLNLVVDSGNLITAARCG